MNDERQRAKGNLGQKVNDKAKEQKWQKAMYGEKQMRHKWKKAIKGKK
jgi:hypothetical protein